MLRRSPALAVVLTLALAASSTLGTGCQDDANGSEAAAGADAAPPDHDTGGPGEAGAGDASSANPGPGADGGVAPLPGAVLALPFDTLLLTVAAPLNIDKETDVVVDGSLYYTTAYESGVLQEKGNYFQFTTRIHATPDELPAGGIRVWWRKITDEGKSTGYVCRGYDGPQASRTITTQYLPTGESADGPGDVWRNQCAWTLWKHATNGAWAIRAPEGKSTVEGGMMVTKRHGSATEGNCIRVSGSPLDNAPFFTFKMRM